MLFSLVGELGKLLGNKWKELDDDEKKVIYLSCSYTRQMYANMRSANSRMLSAQRKTKPALKQRRKLSKYDLFSFRF
jgi:hypothetical protein